MPPASKRPNAASNTSKRRTQSTSESPAYRRDPADLLADSKTELLHQTIDNAIPLVHHLIDQIIERHNLEEPEGRVRALRGAVPIINPLNEPAERAHAIAYFVDRIGRDETLVQDALHRYASSPQRRREQEPGRSLA
jgi:DNA primase